MSRRRRRRAPRRAPRPLSARRPRSRAVDIPLELPAEDGLEPLGYGDERIEVDARLDAFPPEQINEILGRDVARRSRRVRAAAEPAHRRIEEACSRLERSEAVRVPGVAGVVTV